MHRKCASYGEAVLHKIRLTMKHCSVSLLNMKHFRLRSNMKHSAYAAYDEKMKMVKFASPAVYGLLRTFTDSDGPDRLLRCAKK